MAYELAELAFWVGVLADRYGFKCFDWNGLWGVLRIVGWVVNVNWAAVLKRNGGRSEYGSVLCSSLETAD